MYCHALEPEPLAVGRLDTTENRHARKRCEAMCDARILNVRIDERTIPCAHARRRLAHTHQLASNHVHSSLSPQLDAHRARRVHQLAVGVDT